jgi:hypothetical protein
MTTTTPDRTILLCEPYTISISTQNALREVDEVCAFVGALAFKVPDSYG